jgi:hypothetical protein
VRRACEQALLDHVTGELDMAGLEHLDLGHDPRIEDRLSHYAQVRHRIHEHPLTKVGCADIEAADFGAELHDVGNAFGRSQQIRAGLRRD